MIADSVFSAYSVEDKLNADALAQLLFREAVVEVGERAKGVLPECHARIEQAVQLILAGEIQWRPDGSVQCRGRSRKTPPTACKIPVHVQRMSRHRGAGVCIAWQGRLPSGLLPWCRHDWRPSAPAAARASYHT